MIKRLLNEIEFQLDMLKYMIDNNLPLWGFRMTSSYIKNACIQNGDIRHDELLFKSNIKQINKMERMIQKHYLCK